MLFENHCSTTLDTSLEPNAIIHLDHLPEGTKEKIPDDLPRFHDIGKPDQWEEFASLLERNVFLRQSDKVKAYSYIAYWKKLVISKSSI